MGILFTYQQACEVLSIKAHILEYWISLLPMLSIHHTAPAETQGYFTSEDIGVLLYFKFLLYSRLYSIARAQSLIDYSYNTIQTSTTDSIHQLRNQLIEQLWMLKFK